jgi:hypothetical protein
MAIDIGIGKRQSEWKKHFQREYKKEHREYIQRRNYSLEGAEARRGKRDMSRAPPYTSPANRSIIVAWLVNYFLCIT